jgi:hypothetical protein
MSCRAFSRRIEFQTLKTLGERLGAQEMVFAFAATPKNGPTQEFFAGVLGTSPSPPVCFSTALFAEKCPRLYHQVIV